MIFTPREIIYRIKSTYKEHKGNSVLFNGHVWNIFQTSLRNVYQNNLELKRLLRSSEFGTVKEINMISVAGNTIGLPDCDTICRSTKEFDLDIIDSVYTTDLVNPTKIEFVAFKDYINKSRVRMPFEPKLAFIYNKYLYSTVCYPIVNVKGTFLSDDSGSCGFLDSEINVPDYLIQNSIDMALKEFNIFKQIQYNRPEEKVTTTQQ